MSGLSRFKLLDLTHMLSGPFGAMILSDLGMDTIKIEPPGRGEGTRRLLADSPEYSSHGMGAYFLTLNRDKKSVCLDLKSADGYRLFLELVKSADVVLDNFSPGVTRKLGIHRDDLKEHNPRIVTCSITGFGSEGPYRNRTAFDLVAQGMGGGMSITGHKDGEPVRSGIPIGDLGGGVFGVVGVLAALHEREETGVGRHVDISMLDCQLAMLNYMGTMHFLSGKNPGPEGNGHFVHVPYNTFATRTRHIILAVIYDSFWESLVNLLDDPELRAEAFRHQPGRLASKEFIEERVQRVLHTRSCEEWVELFEEHRIPCAPVNDFEHAFNNPQVAARRMVTEIVHPDGTRVRMPANPVKMDGFEATEEVHAWPPELGQHTDEVLRDMLGLSSAELDRLRHAGAIG